MTPLTDEQIRELWNINPHFTFRQLISAVLYWRAMAEKAEFRDRHTINGEIDSCIDSRHEWTDAQWIEAATKKVLGEK